MRRKPFERVRRLPDLPASPKEYELLGLEQIQAGAISRQHGIPGVYFLLDKGRVVYVGQTKNLHARIYQHRIETKKVFTDYFLLPCPEEDLTPLESRYMRLYRPKYNVMPRWDRSEAIQYQRAVGEIVEGSE